MTRPRAILFAVVCAAVGLTVWAVVPPLLRRTEFFRIRLIEVVGLHYLEEQNVVQRIGLGPRASTLDPLGPIRAAARAIPGVLSATVERRLPGTLRVTLQEGSPVALTPQDDRLALLDQHGKVLPFDPVRAPSSLPVADRDSSVAMLLARIMTAAPSWFARVESARIFRGEVFLTTGAHRVRLLPEADTDVLRAVIAVQDYLEKHGVIWREIDARYHTRLFVRKGTG